MRQTLDSLAVAGPRGRTVMAAPSRFDTHEVTNQSPPFADVDLFGLDAPLQDAVRHNGAGADVKALVGLRAALGHGRDARSRAPGQRESAAAAGLRCERRAPRLRRVSPGLSPVHGRELRGAAPRLDLAQRRQCRAGARPGQPRGALLHGGAGRDRAPLPDHHDAGRGGGAGRGARAPRPADAPRSRRANTIRCSGPGRKRRASRSAWA